MDYYKLKVLNNKRKIIIIIVVLLVISFGIYYFYGVLEDNDNEILINDSFENDIVKDENISISEEIIWVDIKGYIAKPGVYSFSKSDNARVNDLILKAGGLKKDADTSMINLSKKLEDEMTIVIYSQKEVNNYISEQNDLKNKLELCELKIKNNACINSNSSDNKNDIIININTATQEELEKLSGIGESKAKAIIEYRNKTPFKDIKDILNIEGIGENLFETIKNNIKV